MKKYIVLILLVLASAAVLISQISMTGGSQTSTYTITNNADGITIEDSSGFLRVKPSGSNTRVLVTNAYGTVVYVSLDSNYVDAKGLAGSDLADSTITNVKIDAAPAADYVLATKAAYGYSVWSKVDSTLIEDGTVSEDNLSTQVQEKLIGGAITIDPETQINATGGNTYEVLMDNGGLAVWSMIDSMSLNASSVKTPELASNAVTAVKVTDSTLTSQKTATGTFTSFHHFDVGIWTSIEGLELNKIDANTWLPKVTVKTPLVVSSDTVRLSYDAVSLDTNASGVLQVAAVYAFLKQDDDTTTVTVTTAGTYYDIETWAGGYESSGMTTDTGEPIGGWIRCNTAGIYKVDAAFSFYGTASAVYEVVLYKGAVAQDQISFTRKLGAGGDVGSASCHGIITLAAADTLRFKVTSDDNGDVFSFVRSQFAVHLIGR